MTPLKAFVALMAITVMFEMVVSTNYTVGAPGGSWDTSTDYTNWVSDKTFYVGDYLLFTYSTVHDVWEVTKDDYTTCSKSSPLQKYSGGSTLIELTEAGSRYFICSTSTHCSSDNQKVEVLVVASGPPSDSPPSSPPSDSPPSDSPSNSSSYPPPPPSGDASARNIGITMVIALAFGVMLMMAVY